ncbi:MAG: type VI secretion system-associated FHA domain protein TagH [Gammaproteobacteria bacterium]
MNTVHVNDSELLTQAFLKGAGLPVDAVSALTPELMELIGALLASSIQGTIDLLALRSLVKQEVKSDVTQVVMRNNNPLKFFPDSQTVLAQMLRKKMPGFMEPQEAIEDARRDLRAHQMAVVAGTRASVGSMLRRLHPERIEAGLGEPSLLDKLLASRRAAAAWTRYQRKYQNTHRDVADDSKGVFGTTFREAYENEVQRLEREDA